MRESTTNSGVCSRVMTMSNIPDQQEMLEEQITIVCNAIGNIAPDLAEAQRKVYEAYRDAGFSEEEALELTKEFEVYSDE